MSTDLEKGLLPEELEALATACRIRLTPEEIVKYCADLNALLELVSVLEEGEFSTDAPTRGVALCELRADEPVEDPLAPALPGETYLVPSVLEG